MVHVMSRFFLNVAHLSRLTSHGTKWWCRADSAFSFAHGTFVMIFGTMFFLPTSIWKNSEASTSALFWYPAAWTLGRNQWIWFLSGTGPHSKGVPGTPNQLDGSKSLQRKWLFNQTLFCGNWLFGVPGGNKPLGKPYPDRSPIPGKHGFNSRARLCQVPSQESHTRQGAETAIEEELRPLVDKPVLERAGAWALFERSPVATSWWRTCFWKKSILKQNAYHGHMGGISC